MATLLQIGSAFIYSNAHAKTLQRPQSSACTTVAKMTPLDDKSPIVHRRSANYQPSLWDLQHLLSVENQYAKDKSMRERDLLKEKVRKMLHDEKKTYIDQLEFIEDLRKLGVSYHFEAEIEIFLVSSYKKDRINVTECDLHATALEFRLFRQHGFNVSEDIFDAFMENCKKFESGDINGFISLYEASYLSTKSDSKLQKIIRPFATQQLRDFLNTNGDKDFETCNAREVVVQALDMPYHWRMRRLATRWYIDAYGKRHNKNLVLIQFAKTDFNIVQAVHQEELKYVSSWDVNLLDELPEYMRLYFLVVYNEVNSIGCDILRQKNINVIPFLKKSWTDVCKTHLVEAKWYKRGHKPNLEEYMHNASISVSVPLIFVHFYSVFSDQLSIQVLETLSQHQQNVVRCSASVFRLANDLVTSADELARGDVLKSIQCYMNETGASEEKANSHVRQMIQDLWDEMNYEKMAHSSSLLHRDFMETVMNLARMLIVSCPYSSIPFL